MARPSPNPKILERDRLALRRLHGELDPIEEVRLIQLEAEIGPNPSMETAWNELAPPPGLEADPSLTSDVLEAIERRESRFFGLGSLRIGPVLDPGRHPVVHRVVHQLAAAAILMLGVGLGLQLDTFSSPTSPEAKTGEPSGWSASNDLEQALGEIWPEARFDGSAGEELLPPWPSLAEAYWQALEDTGGRLDRLDEEEPSS